MSVSFSHYRYCHRILGNAFGSPEKLENCGRALTPTSQTPDSSLLLPLPQPVSPHALRTPTADPFPEQAHEAFNSPRFYCRCTGFIE